MNARTIGYALCLSLVLIGCDDKEAARIQEQTEAQLAALSSKGELTHGAVTVAEEGDSYRVAIADVVMLGTPEAQFRLGSIDYLYERIDETLIRYSDIRIAEPILVEDKAGERLASIAVEIERAGGTWSEPLNSFIAFDGVMPSMRIESGGSEPPVELHDVVFKSETADPGAERTSQSGTATIGSVSGTDSDGAKIDLEGVTITSAFENIDLVAFKAAQDSFESASATGENVAPSVVAMLRSFSGLDGRVEVARIVSDHPTDGRFVLDGLAITFNMADADQQLGRMGLAVAFTGIELPAPILAEEPAAELAAPKALGFNIDFSHVPFQDAAMQIANIAPSMEQMAGDQPELAGLMLVSALQAAFAQSGTEIRLDGTRIEFRDATVTIDGGVDVDPNAALGVVGTMEIALYGLDQLFEAANKLPPGPETDDFTGSLAMLGIMSDRAEENGAPVDRYHVEAAPDGAVYVNGEQMF